MPDEAPPWLESSRKLRDYLRVIGGVREEAEGGEEVQHRIEPVLPANRQPAHVAVGVAEAGACPPLPCDPEELTGVIQPVDVVPRLGEQVCMPPLSAGDVQDAGAYRKSKQLDQPRDLRARSLRSE